MDQAMLEVMAIHQKQEREKQQAYEDVVAESQAQRDSLIEGAKNDPSLNIATHGQ